MNLFTNPILLSDSYKVTHWLQYPPGTQTIYSYYESRCKNAEIVFFGLEYYLEQYLQTRVTLAHIEEAAGYFKDHFYGDEHLFNIEGWHHIVNEHGGYFPVRIKAVPEGMVVPSQNVMLTIENTDPQLPWVTNYLETILCHLWAPCTVATNSRKGRKIIASYLHETADDLSGLDYKLHDFGFRGVSSTETAGILGAAHLASGFVGTDTMVAYELADKIYQERMAGFSIPAAEHSTTTAWGQENEVAAYRKMVRRSGKGTCPFYACVSDSYDIFKACDQLWGEALRSEVEEATSILVVRPDSGDPPQVVTQVLEILASKFGSILNTKGYRVLNNVRVIQGDGIDLNVINQVLGAAEEVGFSADNIAFGSGGALLQKFNRDTYQFAFKCSWAGGDGWERDVHKKPVGDPSKDSKPGRLMLVEDDAAFIHTIREEDAIEGYDLDYLELRYENGTIFNSPTFEEIRGRCDFI